MDHELMAGEASAKAVLDPALELTARLLYNLLWVYNPTRLVVGIYIGTGVGASVLTGGKLLEGKGVIGAAIFARRRMAELARTA